MEYGCIGEHLTHSFSKEIHSFFADYNYELTELKPSQIDLFFKNKNFKAVNVTIPYKETVLKYLDEIEEQAKKIGAVNTVVNKNGKLYGYNTDFYGLKALIEKNGTCIKGKKVLILGSGGTSKTAFYVCEFLKAKEILKVSRTEKTGFITYAEALSEHDDAQVIINTTPCGMYPVCEGSAIEPSKFKHLEYAFDAVYNPLKSDFVLSALNSGALAEGGLYMLVAQAAYACEHFISTKISEEKINSVYKKMLFKKKNIVLIGMPSCGKTTTGKALSKILNMPFYDSDTEIEKAEKCSVKDIFSTKGEKYFRNAECDVIKKLSCLSGCIIATGGGSVLNNENVKWLKKNGDLFFIDRPLEKLICTDSRPLSSDKNALKRIYDERYGIYTSVADTVLTSENTVDEILKIIKERYNEDFSNQRT